MTFKAKSHLTRYPNSVKALNYLMEAERDQWKLTREVREQFNMDMSEWRRFIAAFGRKNGINVLESTGNYDNNAPSTVRYIHSDRNDLMVRKILGRVNA